MQMDPSLDGHATGGKAGYDCTWPVGRPWAVQQLAPAARRFAGEARHRSVEDALMTGPLFFTHLMEAVGSRDGREVTLELDALRRAGRLGRDSDGRYHIAQSEPGRTVQVGPRGHDPNML
jgi:hypothetical protein